MNKNYLKNSEALKPIFEEAETICHDILEAQDAGNLISAKIGDLANGLFDKCRTISKNEGLSPSEIFNNLQFMLGYNYKADDTGAPDLSGKNYKTEAGAWPKGTLSTYRSVMLACEKRLGKSLHDFPTFDTLRQALKTEPQKNELIEAIKEVNKSDLPEKEKARIERVMMACLKQELTASIKAAKAPAKSKAKAAPKAAPKSHAKKAA